MAEYEDYIITIAPNDKVRDLVRCCRSFAPIVRCRDCKHSTGDGTCCWYFSHYEQVGDDHEWDEVPDDVEPDGFCKWGERRSDGED